MLAWAMKTSIEKIAAPRLIVLDYLLSFFSLFSFELIKMTEWSEWMEWMDRKPNTFRLQPIPSVFNE